MKTSADTNALQPGTALHGRRTYVIEGVLGVGGFGITYLASTTFTLENLQTKGYVAIKEHFMSDHCERIAGSTKVVVSGTAKIRELVANARKDFLAEARRLAQLGGQHNNIVRVNEVFEGNGTAYFVMEYLEGHSLEQFIADNGPLGEDTLRGIITPVVDAVAFLHRNHFTHLDIKPANIMLTATPYGGIRPVLIDFGLSKHYDEHGNATSAINTCGASDGYAPVEQYQGIRTFSPTADVYALGATMLACATGRRPTASANWMPGEPAASISALSLSPQLKQAMTVALSQSPHCRYPDAGALLTAIGGGGGSETHAFVPHTPKPDTSTRALPRTHPAKPGSKKWFFLAIALVAVILAGAAYVFMDRDREEEYAPDTDASSQAMTDAWWAARRTPRNLDLAVNRGGSQYYLSRADYNCLSPVQQSRLNKIGVVVIGNDRKERRQSFILALHDLSSEVMDWNEAMRRYANFLPTKDQGYVWNSNFDAIKSAINDFRGNRLLENAAYWSQTEYSSSHAYIVGGYGDSYATNRTNTYRVRAVAPIGGTPGQTQNGDWVNPSTYASERPEEMTDAWWSARRTPHNLELAVNRGGSQYYLSCADYRSLSPSQRSSLNKVGVVVMGNDENGRRQSFILALDELASEEIDWNGAMRRYGNFLPTKDQVYVWGRNSDAIKSAIDYFGDNSWRTYMDSYWIKTMYGSSGAWNVSMSNGAVHAYLTTNTYRVRAVAPTGGIPGQTQNGDRVNTSSYAYGRLEEMAYAWWAARRTPHNLELAVNRGDSQYYLSRLDYYSLTQQQKSALNKVGVVVMGNDEKGRRQCFILALNDLTPEIIDWDEAMRRYGNSLPTKDQAYVWAHQREAIKSAINDFGGISWPANVNNMYWTKTEESSSYAWYVGMNYSYGSVNVNGNYKTYTYKVRAVAAVPGS